MKALALTALLPALTLTALPASARAAEDHDAAPMMAPAQAPLTEDAYREKHKPGGRQGQADAIIAAFRERFDQPRIAVFWHRALPDRVSDWHSRQRVAVGQSARVSGQADGESVDMQGQASAGAQLEYRGAAPAEGGNRAAFELQDGLIQTFQDGGARMIDQSLAQRLTDNALEDGTFSRLSPDHARLQMRALAEHADYVLELTAAPGFDQAPGYRVRVLSTADASVLATFVTSGEPPEDEREHSWVATSNGYQKREQPLLLSEVGREVALRTMEKMRP